MVRFEVFNEAGADGCSMPTRRGPRHGGTRRQSSRIAWFVSFFGAFVAVVAGYALVGVPVVSEVVAVVRSLAAVAGVGVAAGGALAATNRLPVHPVAPMAAVPGSLAAAAVVVSVENVSTWIRVGALVGLTCGLAGFLLVTYAARDDKP